MRANNVRPACKVASAQNRPAETFRAWHAARLAADRMTRLGYVPDGIFPRSYVYVGLGEDRNTHAA